MSDKRKVINEGIDAILGLSKEKPNKPKKVLRPTSSASRETKTTLYMDEELIDCMRALAFWDRKPIKAIIMEALRAYRRQRGEEEIQQAFSEFRKSRKSTEVA